MKEGVANDNDSTGHVYTPHPQDHSPLVTADDKTEIVRWPRLRTAVSTPISRLRSRVVYLFWLCVVALYFGSLSLGLMQQEAVGTVLQRVGSCIHGAEFEGQEAPVMLGDNAFADSSHAELNLATYLYGAPTESFRGPCR